MSTTVTCPITYETVLTDLIDLVLATRHIIDNFFPPISTMAPNVSKMGYKTSFPKPLYMLLLFMQVYPKVPFDPSNPRHLNNLKDIYLSGGASWEKDPFITDGIRLGII